MLITNLQEEQVFAARVRVDGVYNDSLSVLLT